MNRRTFSKKGASTKAREEREHLARRAETEKRNREREQADEDKLRRQLEGPCPRCSFHPLIVYFHRGDLDSDGVDRHELVTEVGKELDAEFEAPECTQFDLERLIYCPNCGALHEIGGETHYPQSGIVGKPAPLAEVIPFASIPFLTGKVPADE